MVTHCDSCTSTFSAKPPVRMLCTSELPLLSVIGDLASRGNWVVQVTGIPRTQPWQWPHERIKVTTTGSPTFTVVTPRPTASTTPAHSCPYTAGRSPPHAPSAYEMSLWQMAVAANFTLTSPGPASTRFTSSMTRGLPNSLQTAAFMMTFPSLSGLGRFSVMRARHARGWTDGRTARRVRCSRTGGGGFHPR